MSLFFFFFQAEDGIRDYKVTGVQTCALPICATRSLEFSFSTPQRSARVIFELTDGGIEVGGRDDPAAAPVGAPAGRLVLIDRDRKSVGVGKECRSRWSPYH